MYYHEQPVEMTTQVRVQELMREADHIRLVRMAQRAKSQSKPSRRLPFFGRLTRATAGFNR